MYLCNMLWINFVPRTFFSWVVCLIAVCAWICTFPLPLCFSKSCKTNCWFFRSIKQLCIHTHGTHACMETCRSDILVKCFFPLCMLYCYCKVLLFICVLSKLNQTTDCSLVSNGLTWDCFLNWQKLFQAVKSSFSSVW